MNTETTWKIAELTQILNLEGSDYKILLNTIRSFETCVLFFRYHQEEAQNASLPYVGNSNTSSIDAICYALSAMDNETQKQFDYAMLVEQANTVASIYTLRSAFDIFAQIARLALNLSISQDKCDIKKISKELTKKQIPLSQNLSEILNSDEFKYIDAFCNLSKHNYLVEYTYIVSTTDDTKDTSFHKFEHNGNKFNELETKKIRQNLVKLLKSLINLGIKLNNDIEDK